MLFYFSFFLNLILKHTSYLNVTMGSQATTVITPVETIEDAPIKAEPEPQAKSVKTGLRAVLSPFLISILIEMTLLTFSVRLFGSSKSNFT